MTMCSAELAVKDFSENGERYYEDIFSAVEKFASDLKAPFSVRRNDDFSRLCVVSPYDGEAVCNALFDAGYVAETFFDDETVFIVTCRTCKGAGHHVRRLSPAERIERQRTQRQQFDREQLAAGHVPLAGAYTERSATDELSPEAFAHLAQRCPKPCKTCLGLGIEPCRKCKGTGQITERERDEDGEIVETEVNCPTCHGTATQPCRRCDGSRLAPLCKKCGGTGVVMGKAKNDLPAQLERCRSCKGEGRK